MRPQGCRYRSGPDAGCGKSLAFPAQLFSRRIVLLALLLFSETAAAVRLDDSDVSDTVAFGSDASGLVADSSSAENTNNVTELEIAWLGRTPDNEILLTCKLNMTTSENVSLFQVSAETPDFDSLSEGLRAAANPAEASKNSSNASMPLFVIVADKADNSRTLMTQHEGEGETEAALQQLEEDASGSISGGESLISLSSGNESNSSANASNSTTITTTTTTAPPAVMPRVFCEGYMDDTCPGMHLEHRIDASGAGGAKGRLGWIEANLWNQSNLLNSSEHLQIDPLAVDPVTNKTAGSCSECPCKLDVRHELEGDILRAKRSFIGSACETGRAPRILHLGLGADGAGILPTHLERTCKNSQNTVSEKNLQRLGIARQFLGGAWRREEVDTCQNAIEKRLVHPGNGSNASNESGNASNVSGNRSEWFKSGGATFPPCCTKQFDFIVLGVVDTARKWIPAACSDSTYARNVYKMLRPGGCFLIDFGGYPIENPDFTSELDSLFDAGCRTEWDRVGVWCKGSGVPDCGRTTITWSDKKGSGCAEDHTGELYIRKREP